MGAEGGVVGWSMGVGRVALNRHEKGCGRKWKGVCNGGLDTGLRKETGKGICNGESGFRIWDERGNGSGDGNGAGKGNETKGGNAPDLIGRETRGWGRERRPLPRT